ncbi:MAG: ABC transporter permease, partial [Opitutus sp.]
ESLLEVFAFAPSRNLTVSVDGNAEIVSGVQVVSGNYHTGLGVTAAVGRLITLGDDQPTAEPVAVISYGYWQRRFGGDVAAIGKNVTVNGMPVTIVGVTAPAFKGAMQVGDVINLTLPLVFAQRLGGNRRDGQNWWVRIMGRLKAGVTAERALATLDGVFRETARGNLHFNTLPGAPAVDQANIPLPQLRVVPGGQGLSEARREYKRSLRLLMGVVALVLLVACANVANLLLARGAARRREIAVRLALGASRARLVRQLLAESILLAALGAATGLVFSVWGTRALIALQPFGSRPLEFDTPLDWRVLAFTSVGALGTGIFFGLAPALRATRLNLTEEFQGGGRALGTGSRSALAKSLMVTQVALSVVLMVGAGLFVRTLRNLQNVDVGFNREQLLLFEVSPAIKGVRGSRIKATVDRVRDGIANLPAVRSASYTQVAPLSRANWGMSVVVPGYTQKTINEFTAVNPVDTEYIATMVIPILRGRDFNVHDAAGAPNVAIVNQSFAKKYFGTEEVISRRFSRNSLNNGDPDIEIVGLLRDTQHSDLKTSHVPVVYFPIWQFDDSGGTLTFVVRFTGSEATVISAVRAAVRAVDPNLPLSNVRTQEQQIGRLLAQERLFAKLCSVFAALTLTLSAIGLYGLMSYAVVRRTGEIGLRMALGAPPAHVLRMILRESLMLVMLGVLVGVAAAMGATRWIASMLFGLSADDPITYVCVALVLMAVAVIACLLPARRAAKIDPMVALRTE